MENTCETTVVVAGTWPVSARLRWVSQVRHRAEVAEFRVEQHFERLGDQFVRLGYDIKSVITEGTAGGNETPAQTEVEAGG